MITAMTDAGDLVGVQFGKGRGWVPEMSGRSGVVARATCGDCVDEGVDGVEEVVRQLLGGHLYPAGSTPEENFGLHSRTVEVETTRARP